MCETLLIVTDKREITLIYYLHKVHESFKNSNEMKSKRLQIHQM